MFLNDFFKKIWPQRPAWKDKNYRVRLKAVKKISDQKILEKVALKDPYHYVKYIDKPFPFYAVRDLAIQKLKNVKVLKKIEFSDNYYLKQAAQKRLYYLKHGKKKYEEPRSSYHDGRNDMDPHQSPFGFKR